MSRLGDILARLRGSRDRVALERAKQEQGKSPAERRALEEDYEARKDDVQAEEYLPHLNDEP